MFTIDFLRTQTYADERDIKGCKNDNVGGHLRSWINYIGYKYRKSSGF